MKTIGMIGGMSWESSSVYYQLINKKVQEKLGGFHSCKSLMYTVDFAEIEELQHKNDWDSLNTKMAEAAQHLYKGGADIIVLCTNTMHLCSDAITNATPLPFLHIADATGKAIQDKYLSKVGLLGTKFTMQKDFYKKRLLDNFDIYTLVPSVQDQHKIHTIIYDELVKGILKEESKKVIIETIDRLGQQGAEGIILGCTEIPLLIDQNDVDILLFNTTEIHAEEAVSMALS